MSRFPSCSSSLHASSSGTATASHTTASASSVVRSVSSHALARATIPPVSPQLADAGVDADVDLNVDVDADVDTEAADSWDAMLLLIESTDVCRVCERNLPPPLLSGIGEKLRTAAEV